MQFSDRPENQVGFAWGEQFADALLAAGVKASSGSRRRRSPARPRIPRRKTAAHSETTRISNPDGSTRAIRVRLVHTDKTPEVERLKENGWIFPEKEIIEEV